MPAGAELLVQDLLDRLGALQRNNNERVCSSIVAEMLVSGVSAILWQYDQMEVRFSKISQSQGLLLVETAY